MKAPRFRTLLTMLCMALFVASYAQKSKVYEGSFDALKGENQLNAVYDYSKMSVGDFDKEADYIAKRTKERNEDEAGSGDQWASAWVADRKGRFEPMFEAAFNEDMADHKLKAGSYPDAKYTLIVKTTHTEPGFNVGVARQPAHINVDYWLVETNDRDKVLGKMSIDKVKGKDFWGTDFDTGQRLGTAYEYAAKALAKYLNKSVM